MYYSEDNVLDNLSNSISNIENAAYYDEKLSQPLENLKNIYISIQDNSLFIRDYKNDLEFSPDELDNLSSRLERINRLKRKYGETIEEILKTLDEAKITLNHIDNIDEEIATTHKKYTDAINRYIDASEQLSITRKEGAAQLSERIEKELTALGIKTPEFSVSFKRLNDQHINEHGIDEVEFLISTNVGQELKSLSKTASGGEISRIMLAIKSILAEKDDVDTLVFDEIDTGISGRIAQAVAEKMTILASKHQIIAITHLPQLTSMADSHFLISKKVKDNGTVTTINLLNDEDKVAELARMLGGVKINDAAINNANSLIIQATQFKKINLHTN